MLLSEYIPTPLFRYDISVCLVLAKGPQDPEGRVCHINRVDRNNNNSIQFNLFMCKT
jgi:hypothetical protein